MHIYFNKKKTFFIIFTFFCGYNINVCNILKIYNNNYIINNTLYINQSFVYLEFRSYDYLF